jgi:hypothetical protein
VAIKREWSILFNNFLDNFLPPILHDARWFMSLPMKILFKDKAKTISDFKKRVYGYTTEEFAGVYEEVSDSNLQGETDLNQECVEAILQSLTGDTALEVGSGRGYLANTLEHVRDIVRSLEELRRVARKRLIIVVPKQRPYLYTFNLHIHFFPYDFSLLAILRPKSNYQLKNLGGDWFYIENK